MSLRIKLIVNVAFIAIIDYALLYGGYLLFKQFDWIVFGILLASLGVGIAVVLETLGIVKNLVDFRTTTQCECEDPDYDYDSGDYEDCYCDGDCGDDCCQITGGPCCGDR